MKCLIQLEFNIHVLTQQLTCHNSVPMSSWLWRWSETRSRMVALRSHMSQELRVGIMRRNKSSWVRLYLEFCRYECSLGSESQNRRRWRITSDIRYNHDQGALVFVISHLYGSLVCIAKFKIPSHPSDSGCTCCI